MTRRLLVPEGDGCPVCDLKRRWPDTADAYAAGYVAGMHVVGHGDRAEERVCAEHASVLDDAVADYVKHGILT